MHTVTGTFQDLGFIVAAFSKTVCVRTVKGVEYVFAPVMHSFCAPCKFRQIRLLSIVEPFGKPFSSKGRIG